MGPAVFMETLTENGMGGVDVCVGENLSYENEKIIRGKAEELSSATFDPLAVVDVNSCRAKDSVTTPGLSDQSFVRGKVPMTKEEVRAVTLSPELRLTEGYSTVYDIGSGRRLPYRWSARCIAIWDTCLPSKKVRRGIF